MWSTLQIWWPYPVFKKARKQIGIAVQQWKFITEVEWLEQMEAVQLLRKEFEKNNYNELNLLSFL